MNSENETNLKEDLEILPEIMINYCNVKGLMLNGSKTQIHTTSRNKIKIKVDGSLVTSSDTIKVLGLEYDRNFSISPHLRHLACEANTCTTLIMRLCYSIPNCLLNPILSRGEALWPP